MKSLQQEIIKYVAVEYKDMYIVSHYFKNMHDTVILSCLQGHMGRAFTNSLEHPYGAMIQGGSFLFIAGDEKNAGVIELISNALDITGQNLAFVIPENPKLGKLVEDCYGEDCRKIQRFGIKKKTDEFNLNKLNEIINSLPSEYTLSPIDERNYQEVVNEEWSEDFVSNFLSKEDYIKRGIGRVILHNNKVVSGASSYTIYNEGIEIEIATKEEYRNKGLATIAGAALILACVKKGLYPSWDAANMTSVRLAEKLGYEYDKPYDTYMIRKTPKKDMV